ARWLGQDAYDRNARVDQYGLLFGKRVRIQFLMPSMESRRKLLHQIVRFNIDMIDGHGYFEYLLTVAHLDRALDVDAPLKTSLRQCRTPFLFHFGKCRAHGLALKTAGFTNVCAHARIT